jgi:hypothetical protein
MISFKLKLFLHLASLLFIEIQDLGQCVSGSVIEIDAVVSAAPDEHFVARPNGWMERSLRRRAAGGHGLPGVRSRTVIPAIIEKCVGWLLPAPDEHLAAGPQCRMIITWFWRTIGVQWCPRISRRILKAAVIQSLPL